MTTKRCFFFVFLCFRGCILACATVASAQVRVQTIDGTPADALAAPAGTKAIVFLFTSTDCPISNRYAPEVRRVVSTYASQGVVFRLVYPNPAEQAPAIREHIAAFGYGDAMQPLRDPKLALVKYVKATVTPEAASEFNFMLHSCAASP